MLTARKSGRGDQPIPPRPDPPPRCYVRACNALRVHFDILVPLLYTITTSHIVRLPIGINLIKIRLVNDPLLRVRYAN